ncbi:MAG: hypothetical protein ABTR92_19610 [Candidatus Accumulibacter phosphatis]
MSALLQKLLRARETQIPVGEYVFTIRRPTPLEHEEKLSKGNNPARGILSFVVGWENVTSADIIPGGDPHPLAFEAAVCAEWLSDRPDLFAPIAEAIVQAYRAHILALEDSLKN